MNIIYVDNNATTRVAPEVFEAHHALPHRRLLQPELDVRAGARARPRPSPQRARRSPDCLGDARPAEILFTSCATESNNTAIFGAIAGQPGPAPHHHHRGRAPGRLRGLQGSRSARASRSTFLPVDRDGSIDVTEFVRALRPDTLLVTIMHANNETGVIFPIEELARLTKETDPSIIFHTDATQTVGKLPIDLDGAFKHVDLLSFSGHKLHAPKGVGALFIRRGTPLPAVPARRAPGGRTPGRHRERAPSSSASPRPCELAMEHHDEDEARIRGMRDRLERELDGADPLPRGQRQERPAAAQHPQRRLPLHRGRGHPLPAQRPRHLRLQRFGLHLGLPRAVPRPPGHAHPVHRRSTARCASASAATTPTRRSTRSSRSSPGSSTACAGSRPTGMRRRTSRGPRPWRC